MPVKMEFTNSSSVPNCIDSLLCIKKYYTGAARMTEVLNVFIDGIHNRYTGKRTFIDLKGQNG